MLTEVCPPIISVENKQNQRKKASSRVTHFHLYYLIWKEIEFVLLSFRKQKKVNKISCQNTTRKLMGGTQDE